MRLSIKNKHIVLIICLVLAQGIGFARGYNASDAAHYIGIAIGGGEANDIAKNLHPLAGAAGNVTLFYEMQKNRVSFSVGVQAQYQYTRDSITPFIQGFDRSDIMGAVNYQYVYSNWLDKHADLRVAIPVRVGYNLNDYLYFLVGADVSMSLLSQYTTTAHMFTQGVHAWDSKPIRSDDLTDFSTNLGYYQSAEYRSEGPYVENLWVAPALEIGSYIPLRSKRSRLRAGVYTNYGIRIGKRQTLELVDYSAIDMNANPNTQTQSFLQQNLVLNTAINSNQLTALPGNLEVGIRISYMLNMAVQKKTCMCLSY